MRSLIQPRRLAFVALMSFPIVASAQTSSNSIATRSAGSAQTTQSSAVSPSISNSAQTNSATSASPGITDHVDVAVYNQSTDDQSEVHLSINHYNPSVLVCSFNTYVTNISTPSQSHFISTTGGTYWTGSDTYETNNA
ncbi:MAG: hypothetical protein JWR54_1036 [Mucilaginibacter sp.]|nr:hypothetical protein [Mucilaginibacter sp.]